MTLRFLMTTASQHPEYPFQAGQVIHLSGLTPEFRRWLSEGRVELVKDTEPERAVAVAPRVDELHRHKDRAVFDALMKSKKARKRRERSTA